MLISIYLRSIGTLESVLQRWSDLALLQTVVLGLEECVIAVAMKMAWMRECTT
jgi:hypothetical protein